MVRRQARAYLKANGVAAAARSIWQLNRTAKSMHGDDSRPIYFLKNLLLEHWYKQGHCIGATIIRQNLECWSCDGTGWHWTGDYCWKCDGTGIYRSILLYQFVFMIAGRRYCWHQPKDLVDWSVQWLAEPIANYQQRYVAWAPLTNEHFDVLFATVYEYLLDQGLPEEKLIPALSMDKRRPLRTALKYDLWNRTGLLQKWNALRYGKEIPF